MKIAIIGSTGFGGRKIARRLTALVRVLSEGLAEPWQPRELPPADLGPRIPCSEEQIRNGSLAAGRFVWHGLLCCPRFHRAKRKVRRVFFELP